MRVSTPTRPSVLRFALIAIAIVLGLIAQALVAQGNFLWAITPFVVGVGAIGLATFRHVIHVSDSETGFSRAHSFGAWRRNQSRESLFALLGVAISAFFLLLSLFSFRGEPPNTAAWWLYGLSMVILLASLPALDPPEAGWTALARRIRARPTFAFDAKSAYVWAMLAAILALALIIRVHDIAELPAGFWFDEAANLINAGHIQQNPGATPVFSRVIPVFYLLPTAALIGVIGLEPEAIRLVSVAFSVAGVFAVFLLVRFMFGSAPALIAAFVLATMRWDINFSRIGMVPITMSLMTALTAYLTLRALKTRRISDFGFAGFALGLGFWFYSGFQVFPLVVAAILLHHLIFQRPPIRRYIGQLALMGVVAFAVVAPLAQFAVTDSETFFSRLDQTSIWSNRSVGDAFDEARKSFAKHALMFNIEGDENPRHNLPEKAMLDFFSAAMLVLGIGMALFRWRSAGMTMLIVWLVVMVMPGVLTLPFEAPQALRSIGVLPAVATLVALPLAALWNAGREASNRQIRRGSITALAILLSAIAFANIDTYFDEQANDPRVYAAFSTDGVLIGRHMIGQQARGYTLLSSRQFKFSLQIDLEANRPSYEAIFAPSDIPIDAAKVADGAAIYLEPREEGVFRLLRAYYPEAHFEEVRPPNGGDAMFYLALISREQLESKQGLEARYTLPNGLVRENLLSATQSVWFLEFEPDELPAQMEWKGSLHVTEAGLYTLALDGETDAEVFLDGRRVLGEDRKTVRIEPAVGLHSLEVTGRIEQRASAFQLLWEPPNGDLSPIPMGNLFRDSVRPVGLAGQFHQSLNNRDVVDASHVTPFLDTFWYNPVLPEPYFAVWDGKINIPIPGDYGFEVSGFGDVELFIDGLPAARHPGGGSSRAIPLSSGEHDIKLEYTSPSPPSEFEVLWTPFSSSKQQIPIELLRPNPERMFRVVDGE